MKKILNIFVALAMVMVAFVPLAMADTVPTKAQISAMGNPPVFESTFVMNDTADPTHVVPGTQIMPLPGVGMTETYTHFWKYCVVSDPNGMADIAAVTEYLIDTDGNSGPETPTIEVVDNSEVMAILDSALAQNLITVAEYNDLKFKLDPFKKQARMFKVENSLNNHDKPGIYTVKFKAVDLGGAHTVDISTVFQYMALKSLELDFTQVDYGFISVNVEKWVAGDEDWSTPLMPTLKNQGNANLGISVQASDMIGENLGEPISADHLSVELLGQHVYGLSSPVVLNGQLTPCTPTQISFDIKAPSGTAADIYNGDLTIIIA